MESIIFLVFDDFSVVPDLVNYAINCIYQSLHNIYQWLYKIDVATLLESSTKMLSKF